MLTIDHQYIQNLIGPRPKDSHKGSNGRGLILAGSSGLSGAAVMCACAAQRGGIGLLKVLCTEDVRPGLRIAGGYGIVLRKKLGKCGYGKNCRAYLMGGLYMRRPGHGAGMRQHHKDGSGITKAGCNGCGWA